MILLTRTRAIECCYQDLLTAILAFGANWVAEA
jgi:hypothetical protein